MEISSLASAIRVREAFHQRPSDLLIGIGIVLGMLEVLKY